MKCSECFVFSCIWPTLPAHGSVVLITFCSLRIFIHSTRRGATEGGYTHNHKLPKIVIFTHGKSQGYGVPITIEEMILEHLSKKL